MQHSWLAFIPFANTYICGQVAFENKAKTFILLALNIILSIVSSIVCLTSISYYEMNAKLTLISWMSWIYMIFFFYASYQIFKKYSDKAVIMLVFSILSCGLLTPIFLFAIRNNERKIDVK